MTDNDIIKKINNAISDSTPDILGELLSELDNGQIETRSEGKRIFLSRKRIQIICACAAAVLIFIGSFSIFSRTDRAYAVIGLDVNPGIELTIDDKEKVIKAQAANNTGKTILHDLDLKGSDAKVACYAIVGSMLTKGYLTSTSNSVFVSVSSSDENRGREIEKTISHELNSYTENYQIAVSVFGQYISDDESLKKFAEKEHISLGKAWLIRQLAAKSKGRMTTESLLKMPVQDLILLMQEKKISTGSSYGKADKSRYIGTKKAIAIALADAGISEKQAGKVSAEYECENGSIIYEVEFEYNGIEYEYDIDALTGKIILSDTETGHRSNGIQKKNYSYDDDDDDDDDDDREDHDDDDDDDNDDREDHNDDDDDD